MKTLHVSLVYAVRHTLNECVHKESKFRGGWPAFVFSIKAFQPDGNLSVTIVKSAKTNFSTKATPFRLVRGKM